MSLDKEGKVVNIHSATKRLIDVATLGEEKVITARDLIQMFVDGKASGAQTVAILGQNGVMQDYILGAIAFSMGIVPTAEPLSGSDAGMKYGPWRDWDGLAESPQMEDSRRVVEIERRDGELYKAPVENMDWKQYGLMSDIVRYRVALEGEPS